MVHNAFAPYRGAFIVPAVAPSSRSSLKDSLLYFVSKVRISSFSRITSRMPVHTALYSCVSPDPWYSAIGKHQTLGALEGFNPVASLEQPPSTN